MLSPATASYDQFDDFEDRGDSFRTPRRALAVNGRWKKRSLERQLLVFVLLALTLVRARDGLQRDVRVGCARERQPVAFLERQGIYACIGFGLMVVASRTDFRKLSLPRRPDDRCARLFLAVLVVGQRINGARRWIGFGPAAFQPSELAKLALVIWCAA